MTIPENDWVRYISRLSRISKKAAELMQEYIDKHGTENRRELISYAYELSATYGEAAASLTCEMYDALSGAQGAGVRSAEMVETVTERETAKAILGTMKNKDNSVPQTVGRLGKQAGAVTALKNAQRDGAEFAWVPHGDTCPFCIMLASRGWQKMSKAALKGGHAEHIHANCDCTFAVRFDGKSSVEGYEPEKYREMYDNAEGETTEEKLNSMRREIAAGKSEPETVGNMTLWRKKHPEPIERALKNANPGYLTGREYQMNCQRCVPAYEMLRRGYIVKAKPALLDNTGWIADYDDTVRSKRWKKPFKGMSWSTPGVTRQEIETAMKSYGDGARAEIYVKWPDKGSHVFIAEQSQGKTLFLDPQTGKKNCSAYFTKAKSASIMFARIDGLEPCDEFDIFIESSR